MPDDNLKNIKAVIFDLDGVLCSTDVYHYEAWKNLSDRLGLKFDKRINDSLRGVGRIDCIEIILKENGKEMTKEEKTKYANEKNEYYVKLLDNLSKDDLYKDAIYILDTLKKRGYLLAVGSSSKNTRLILEKTGIIEKFDAISDGNNIQKSKPDPEVFLKAAEYLNTDKKDCIVVEDAISGIQAAKNASMKSIFFSNEDKGKISDYKIENLSQILDILK